MLLVVSTVLMASSAVLWASIVEERRPSLWVLATALFCYLHVVVVGRLLSLVNQLGTSWAWLAGDLVLLLLAVGVWRCRDRPPVGPSVSKAQVLAVFRGRLAAIGVGLLLLSVAVLYAVLFVASVSIAQNVDDAVTAYLARAGYWIQHGNLSPFETSVYNSVQVSYPVNAQLLTVRSIVLAGSGRFVGIEQWFAALVCGVGVYGLSRVLGASARLALIVGSCLILAPVVVVQAGIALTDLITTSTILIATTFGVEGWTAQSKRHLVLSALATGVAVGTKQTVLFIGPAVVLILLLVLATSWHRRRVWLMWIGVTAVVMVPLGLVDFVQNWRYFGHPLGDPEAFELFAIDAGQSARASAAFRNGRSVLIDSIFADVPPGWLEQVPEFSRMSRYEPRVASGGYFVQFGAAWLGIVASTVLIVGAVLAIARMRRKDMRPSLVILALGVTYALTMLIVRPNYSAAFSRYMLISQALLLAVAAVGLSSIPLARSGRDRRVGFGLALCVLAASVGQAARAALTIPSRPLIGEQSTWGWNASQMLRVTRGFLNREDLADLSDYVERCVSDDGRLVLMVPTKFPQSVLFGPSYHRDVVQLRPPYDEVDAEFIAERAADVVIVDRSGESHVQIEPALREVRFGRYAVVLSPDLQNRPACADESSRG
jgi:4-amino-4-deoxy-L-arabinose transferase-like glycosyltransferase